MTSRALDLDGLQLLEPQLHEDARGHFYEAWNERTFRDLVPGAYEFVQDNQSRSGRGVLRGLHYQLPNPQGKLVRVLAGSAFVAAVDIRRSSPTFGRWTSVILTGSNRRQLWLPPGFAHGFLAQDDPTDVLYKVTAFFTPGCDRVIRWDDPSIAIDWPLETDAVLSDKDRSAPDLADAVVFE